MKKFIKIHLTIQIVLSGFMIPEVLYTFWKHTELGLSALGYLLSVITIWLYAVYSFHKNKELG